MKNSLLDLSFDEIENLVTSYGEQKFHAKQIFNFVMNGKEIEEMTSLSKLFREKLLAEYVSNPVSIIKDIKSADGTIKFLFKLLDDNVIEGVLMKYKYGNTLCVSSQVGCRMGCKFCASGLNGLVRNLTKAEILGEVIAVNKFLGGSNENRKITNIVLMGSGEPLDNYDEVVEFIKTVSSKQSLNISQRNISLSTCGLVDKIKKLADDGLSITLTISLHAPNDLIRNQIMPISKKYSIKELTESAKYYFEKTGRRVVFEYAMIDGINNNLDCAKQLKQLIKGFSAHINLIPLNSVKERGLAGASKHQVYWFRDKLEEFGLSATVRRTMGDDIDGACGQLRNKYLKNS